MIELAEICALVWREKRQQRHDINISFSKGPEKVVQISQVFRLLLIVKPTFTDFERTFPIADDFKSKI